MTRELTTLDQRPSALQLAGQAANHAAEKSVFKRYRDGKAPNTLRAQDSDLALFAGFLNSVDIPAGDFARSPAAWSGITWGLVEAFREWLLRQGKAITSINRALSTVKKYAALAFKVGVISQQEHALIRTVTGYAHKEAKHVNEKRQESGLPTRVGRRRPNTSRSRTNRRRR
jgi:site-specific recombinase XerD